MFLVLACISLIIFELSVFIILAFKTRPVRWTFKSFCLWLVSLVSWCCFHHCTYGLSGSGGRLV